MTKSRDFAIEPLKAQKRIRRLLGLVVCTILFQSAFVYLRTDSPTTSFDDTKRNEILSKCAQLHAPAGPPPTRNLRMREASDRWVPGTPPTLLRNANIWTGARNGTEVVYGDILLDKGIIMAVGYIPPALLTSQVRILDAAGLWITPGLVDLHSHIGVGSSPALKGASDTNSRNSPILPWLRSIDGLNTHDESYQLAMAGGVTSAQILPGSANNIGGQAFVIKLRPTAERSATSKVIEPPLTLTHTPNSTEYIRWRHMKHACGENPNRVYGQSRMDGQWNFRKAYNEAKKIRNAQDAFCQRIEEGQLDALTKGEDFPEDLQWESLVDVLRGRVKLSVHCYEAVDLDGIVRLSNEFEFPVASFHHAGETYLVPDLLKKTWGGAPSIALFASNFRKKREAYRGSEFAPAILADHGIPVVMKSDHPVINSRYLLYEAQQAYFYGLNSALALASVTSVPARAAGLGHRIGTIAEGYDADIVLWDSHPLALGATPTQVYVDGIAQLSNPYPLKKPSSFQVLPDVPNWDKEKKETIEWDGLPPLRGWNTNAKSESEVKRIRITGVKSLVGFNEMSDLVGGSLETVFDDDIAKGGRTVIVENGQIVCVQRVADSCDSVPSSSTLRVRETVVDLKGGAIEPGLTTFGSPLGLVEIRLEKSTNDGPVLDPLVDGDLPLILGNGEGGGLIKAVDGLMFEGRSTLLAYRSGVTTAVTAPSGNGFLRGVGTAFSVGAPHALAHGAVVQRETAVHVTMSFLLKAGVSTQVAALRTLLFESDDEIETAWTSVREGIIPLVVSVESADIMATLLNLKYEYEDKTSKKLQLTFSGGTEAHLLAEEIAKAGVSVILTNPRPYPATWEQRRILAGPPLTQTGSVMTLLNASVNVAIGVINEAEARNTRFTVAWAALESNGTMTKTQAIGLATTNLHKALGLSLPKFSVPDLVLYRGGGLLDLESKAVGVLSAARGLVELF